MKLRDAVARISAIGSQGRFMREVRRVVTGGAALAMRSPDELKDRVRGMEEIARRVEEELETWLDPESIARGARGKFDVCDLRVWLQQASMANIPHVPARCILSIDVEDLESILPRYTIPEAVRRRLDKALGDSGHRIEDSPSSPPVAPRKAVREDPMALFDAMAMAMEDIPPSWMVRTHLAGASSLKALVGTGLMQSGDDTAEIAPGVIVGAGWVQHGNRRMIDFADSRFIEIAARGHKPTVHYLARPWMLAAQFFEGQDIHRANSPLAGPGRWPVEWRVFVRNNRVTGVSNYYGWAGDGPTPENAWKALEAGILGQKLVDFMRDSGLAGAFMDTILLRDVADQREDVAAAFADWDEHAFHATIDFMETRDGLMLLEAGPAHAPGGGGHPCAFAGQGVDPDDPARVVAACEGVAFLPMPHVDLGNPKTWRAGEEDGCILAWPEVLGLARAHDVLPEGWKTFCPDGALPSPL